MKSYRQLCGVAKALDLVGDRWTLLIIRDLLIGPMRFSEIENSLQGITTNLLAARLKHLSFLGLIEKQGASKHDPYRLTVCGLSLEKVVFALGEFGWQFLDLKDYSTIRSLRWAMLSLKRRLQPPFTDISIQFSCEASDYAVVLKNNIKEVTATRLPLPDLRISASETQLLKLIATLPHKLKVIPAVEIHGDPGAWEHLVDAARRSPVA
ncbi:MAG: winged helix-turn-helix transcriptional regulator [Thiohalomonadales bacterium]